MLSYYFEDDDTEKPLQAMQSLSAGRMKVRPLCRCCGGGEWRKGYTHCKSVSNFKSTKAKKPPHKDH